MKQPTGSIFSRIIAPLMIFGLFTSCSSAQAFRLKNDELVAEFGPQGLLAIENTKSGGAVHFSADHFVLALEKTSIDGAHLKPQIRNQNGVLIYRYRHAGYSVDVLYELRRDWKFLSKRIEVAESPDPDYKLVEIQPLRLSLRERIANDFTPGTYLPQLGPGAEQHSDQFASGRYGTFLRLTGRQGVMLAVQNPFLEVIRRNQDVSVQYKPEMTWRKEWGTWSSDRAIIGLYQQSGNRIPSRMIYEWKLPSNVQTESGADTSEIQAYTDCVRRFMLRGSQEPISVEVGWTLNDYQIDVATPEGRAEYKRVMDTASDLGIQNLLYAPANHDLALIENDVDDWNWEHVLWLGLGQKIRKGDWDEERSPIPGSVTEMLDYAKSRHLGILAYVYPSLPFTQNAGWIVNDARKKKNQAYATLASREFQDFLIRKLIAFKRRTGIAGYSFDYAFFNLPGNSAYSQWRGWRRVIESLREAEPDTIIDGRQTYQAYGPWSWLAGSYPHPTGNDEQPESFVPYPDLHFDRVSANRTRYVNYWYRNYEFAPTELVPGYMTHQTPRNRNVTTADGRDTVVGTETVYAPFRRRDWDSLGYQYSVLSSIATASWNNVVDMIPGRDLAEFEHFSATDKSWIRRWIRWTVDHKDVLVHTRTILGQPATGHADGTAAIVGNQGYVFLFNPNYKTVKVEIKWDATSGLTERSEFLLKELYPREGRLVGKPGSGLWRRGDVLSLSLEGTSALVLELIPASDFRREDLVFGVTSTEPAKPLQLSRERGILRIDRVAGPRGEKAEASILLKDLKPIQEVYINGKSLPFMQRGRFVSVPMKFAGDTFTRAQEVSLHADPDGSLVGGFTVPRRIRSQLEKRRSLWPIPWTEEDYGTTWLAPDRLLLFVQVAEPRDTAHVTAELDGSVLPLSTAYSSVRKHSDSFVGWYADLSGIDIGRPHSIRLTLPTPERGRLQGVFFDNVEDEYAEELAP